MRILIARVENQAKKLIDLLANESIVAEYLPVQKLNINSANIAKLTNRDSTSDPIFFASPTAIECVVGFIQNLQPDHIILTAGESSARIVNSINPNLRVKYPRHASGIAAMINEHIFAGVNKLLILCGLNMNLSLKEFLNSTQINYQHLALYELNNIFDHYSQAKINNSESIIVVGSSAIARILIASKLDYDKIIFVSIHAHITEILCSKSVLVYETKVSNNTEVVNLIKEICNERNKCQ